MQLSGGTPGTTPPWLAGVQVLPHVPAGANSSLNLTHSCPIIPQTTFSPFFFLSSLQVSEKCFTCLGFFFCLSGAGSFGFGAVKSWSESAMDRLPCAGLRGCRLV